MNNGMPLGDGGTAPTAVSKEYDAFVSYSHNADGDLAPAVQRALQRFAKHWRQRRALEVFRDKTGLAVNPDLWASICTAMDGSEWFVLLCSPGAAQSEWVGREIERWTEHRDVGHLLLVVTEGTLVWDEQMGDIDFDRSTAAHRALGGVFKAEPRHIDMSWARSETDLTLRHRRFRDQIAEIAAPMHHKTKDELEGEDIVQQQRVKRITRMAVGLLVGLSVVALLSGLVAVAAGKRAVTQRDRAERQARTSLSQQLAGQALAAETEQPDARLLEAVAADRIETTSASQGALLSALLDVADVNVLLPGHEGTVADLKMSADGSRMVTADGAGQVRTWSAENGRLLAGPIDADATDVLISGDGSRVAAVGRSGTTRWYDPETGDELHSEDAPEGADVGLACDSWGCARPLVGMSPDGSKVALAMALDDGTHAVRFLGPEASPVDVSMDEPITGLVWHGEDPLLVADTTGIKAWDGEKGPVGENYGFVFSDSPNDPTGAGPVGILPGGADLVPATDDEKARLVMTTPSPTGETADRVLWLDINTGDRRWESAGSSTSVTVEDDPNVSPLREVSYGAIAATSRDEAAIGTDPQVGGSLTPIVLSADTFSDLTSASYWDVPAGAVTRIATADESPIAVGGLDGAVRVIGAGNGVITKEPDAIAERVVDDSSPENLEWLSDLEAPGGMQVAGVAVGRDKSWAALVYSAEPVDADVPAFDRVPSGPVRLAEVSGEDVTPEALTGVEASAVAAAPHDGEVILGSRTGRISYYDRMSGELLAQAQVTDAPIIDVVLSPDGRFLLVYTTEELALLSGDTATRLTTLVARESEVTPSRNPLYQVPGLGGVLSGFDDEGDLWFGWSGDAAEQTGVAQEPTYSGPFGTERVDLVPWLPGSLQGDGIAGTGLEGPGPLDDLTVGDLLDDDPSALDPAPGGSASGNGVSLRLDLGDLAERACAVANRDLSNGEWDRLTGGASPVPVCPDLPRSEGEPPPLLRRDVPRETAKTTGESNRDPAPDNAPDSDAVPTGSTPEEAMEAYLEGPGGGGDATYTGSCLDIEPESQAKGTSCLLSLPSVAGETVGLELSVGSDGSRAVDRLIAVEGPEPWTVHDTWDPLGDDPKPDWADAALTLMESYGYSLPNSGPEGSPEEENPVSADVFDNDPSPDDSSD